MAHGRLTLLLLGGVAWAALGAGPAWAQQTTGPTVDAVIVTARKVTEDLQEVPISMTAVDGQELDRARISTIESLNNIAPNVKIFKLVNASNAFAVYIRGVGRNNNNFNVESPVALYVDDVIYPYQVGPVVDVGGIERVEVLRGPQGTLYGRNATVGAVKYVTVRPKLDEDMYSYAVAVGSFGRAEAQASLSTVMVDNELGAKLDIGLRQYEGYLFDRGTSEQVNGTTAFSGRLAALWRPSEDAELYVAVDGTIDRSPITLNVPVMLDAASGKFVPRYGDYYTTDHQALDVNDLDAAGITVQGRWDTGFTILKSISSYRGFDQKYSTDPAARRDVAYTGIIHDANDSTITQEFQGTGSLFSDRFTYVVGLFYLNSLTKATIIQPATATPSTWYNKQQTNSAAAYMDGTWEIFSGLSIAGGLRYTQDEKEIHQTRRLATGVLTISKDGTESWSALTPRVGIDYKATENILAYASWGRGYKAGQVNSIQPTSLVTAGVFVPPEHTENTEVGLKTEWFERRLRVNANYFWTSYTDQTQAIIGPAGGTLLVYSDAEISGVELEVQARPFPQWSISGTLGTLTSEYVNVEPGHPAFTLADKTLQHAPELTYRIASEYTFEDVLGGSLAIGGDFDHVSMTFQCLNHAPVCIMEAYDLVGAYATYTFPNDRYRLTVEGTNITGTEYFKLGSTNNAWGVAPPAEWSLTFRARM